MKTTAITLLFALMLGSCTHRQPEIYSDSSAAINGYDPVAYFTDGKPVKGDEQFSFQWKDARWLFASKEHMDLFTANPEKFAPQYGGWCAFGCSKGKKATTDPNAWTIVDGKLYLNHSLEVKDKWNQDQKKSIEKADMNWPAIKNN